MTRPVGSKRLEKPQIIEKSSTKHEEKKEKSNINIAATSSKKTTTITATKKISSNKDANTVTKPQINSKTVSSKPKQATPTKLSNATASKVIRQQPMKAIHQVQAKKPVAEKNVMNTVHNVTVASPPPVRKLQPNLELEPEPEISSQVSSVETLPRERTKTRTLEPDEVMILKKAKGGQESTNVSDASAATSTKIEQKPVIIQEPVAYEITFEKAATTEKAATETSSKDMSEEDYEDDFDSYESDFESDSSASKIEDESNSTSISSESPPESPPVTTKLDQDREFDSGTYELKGTAEKVQLDSIDERELHSEGQNDSGFG